MNGGPELQTIKTMPKSPTACSMYLHTYNECTYLHSINTLPLNLTFFKFPIIFLNIIFYRKNTNLVLTISKTKNIMLCYYNHFCVKPT